MLRFVLVISLVILFIIPIYQILKYRMTRIKSELETETQDPRERLEEIKQKKQKLKKDCAEEERSAKRRAKAAKNIQNKL